ncbi:SEC-C metal-binding domain-containing protein [Asticcacaulis sp. AC460]
MRGDRVVHGEKELMEKLGRQDPCPCESGRKFKACCLTRRCFQGHEPLPA